MGELNKDIAKDKVFSSKEQLANEILKGLLKGEVKLVFIKADKTERYMRATRKLNLIEDNKRLQAEMAVLNTETELKKEIRGGTISVVDLDKNAGRKFVLERLLYFQVGDGEVNKVVWEEKKISKEDLKKYYDPTKLDTAEMINILGKKVVRIVFRKKDGTLRAIVGTRNPDLVDLYMNITEGINMKPNKTRDESEESIKRQIERDYVSIFDLEKGEFRSFKPSLIERYDSDLDISSWMEFTIKNDAWYDIARNGADPRQYFQEGKKEAKNIGQVLTERKYYEKDRLEYLEGQKEFHKMIRDRAKYAEELRKENNLKKERRKIIKEIVYNEAKEYAKGTVSKKDKEIYKVLIKVPDLLSNDISFNNMDNEITQVKNFDDLMLVAIQVRHDVFYLHPRFIVNAYSGRVYVDITSNKSFSTIGKVFDSDADWGSEDVLKPIAKKILSIQERKSKLFNTDEGTVHRVNRIITLAEQNRKLFMGYGMNLVVTESPDKTTKMLGVSYKGENYLIHPDVVIQVVEGKGKVIFKVVRTTSRVTEFNNFFKGWIKELNNEQDKRVLIELAKLVLHGLDLRKTVKVV